MTPTLVSENFCLGDVGFDPSPPVPIQQDQPNVLQHQFMAEIVSSF